MKRKQQLLCLILSVCLMLSSVVTTFVSAATTDADKVLDGSAFGTDNILKDNFNENIDHNQIITLTTLPDTITFNLSNLNNQCTLVPNKTSVEFHPKTDTSVTLPTAKKEGYGFDGWTYSSGNVQYGNTKEITEEWIREYYSFVAYHDTLYPVLGRTVIWNFQNGNEETPYYAQFCPGYIETYDSTGVDLSSDYLYVTKKTVNDFGDEKITKSGFVFNHWSDAENGTKDVFDNEDEKYKFGSDVATITTADVNLYAVWDEVPKFDPNGGNWDGNTDAIYGTTIDGEKYTMDVAPTYKYRCFMGWYDTKYACDKVPSDATPIEVGFELNKTYYAGWKSVEYTLNYTNLLPEAKNENPTTYTKSAAEKKAIVLKDAEKDGYCFEGWYPVGNDGKVGTEKITEITDTSTEKEELTLYGKWSYKLKDEEIDGYVGSAITPVNLKLVNEDMSDVTFELAEGETLPEGITLIDGIISGTSIEVFKKSVRLNAINTPENDYNIQGPLLTFNIRNRSTGGSSGKNYIVSFETNGAEKIADQKLKRNSTVTEPEKPLKDGCEFDGWYTDKNLTEKYDFSKKVTKSFTLYAKWNEISEDKEKDNTNSDKKSFDDVDEDDWFYDDVKFVYDNDIMDGTGDGKFAPNKIITRAMFVTMLYRMEQRPTVEKSSPFVDVPVNMYYTDAVSWASQNGIVTGDDENKFSPNDEITREDIATIVFRYSKYKGEVSDDDLNIELSYKDVDDISDYAVLGVKYCASRGIMLGRLNNLFAPKEGTTRAEAAAIVRRTVTVNE